jgi:Putative prokaryotic signal transducing protein
LARLTMALVEAARFYNSFDAGSAKALLDDADIGSVLFDFETANFWGSMVIPIRLMVLDEDLRAATKALSSLII